MTSGEISITEIIRCSNFAAIKHKNQRTICPIKEVYTVQWLYWAQ